MRLIYLIIFVFTIPGLTAQTIVNSGAGTINAQSGSYIVVSADEFTLDTDATGSTSIDSLVILSNAGIYIPASTTNTINTIILRSDASNTGSFINEGTLLGTRTGDVVERYMTKGVWHGISIPVSGQAISDFVTEPLNSIGFNSTTSEYGMMPYDPANNVWDSYFTAATAGDFTIGEGYMVRRKTSGSDGVVSSVGAIQTGDQTISSLVAGKWNCIGNPFTSAIGVTTLASSTDNFLDINAANLDPSYAALYIWDEQANYTGPTRSDYKIISNAGYTPQLSQDYIQSGQAFLVKMESASTSLDISTSMQFYVPDESYLKRSSSPWYGFELSALISDYTARSIFAFNENMSPGLDPTYDAGVLKGSELLSIYSRLVEDNGSNFAVQSLPLDGIEENEIPLGLDFPESGTLRIWISAQSLPSGTKVTLEDRLTGTQTLLTEISDGYTVYLTEGISGTGRFYLQLSDAGEITGPGSIPAIKDDELKVWSYKKSIIIDGEPSPGSRARLYSIDGKLKASWTGLNRGSLLVDAVPEGVYLFIIQETNSTKTFKIILSSD